MTSSEKNRPAKDSDPSTDTAHQQVQQQLAETLVGGSYLVSSGRALVMEVRDDATGLVWMTTESVTQAYFDSLKLEEGLNKVGAATASMDVAGFQCSPDRVGEPVLQRVIDGITYINVAVPSRVTMPTAKGGPVELQVNKHHVIGFEAGREVAILDLPDGHYVEVVGERHKDEALVLPEGGELSAITLSEPWIIELPHPTRAYFWIEHGMRSFQGPVTLPEA